MSGHNRFAELKMDHATEHNEQKKQIDALNTILFGKGRPRSITDEEGQTLINLGNIIVPNIDNYSWGGMEYLARECFVAAYQLSPADGKARPAAFNRLLECDDKLCSYDRDGMDYNGGFDQLLQLGGAFRNHNKQGNTLHADEAEKASDYVIAHLKKNPPNYTLGPAFGKLVLSNVVPPEKKEVAVHAIIANAKALETAQPYEPVFNYEFAMRIIAGEYRLSSYENKDGHKPSYLNEKGRELNSLAIEPLLVFVEKVKASHPKDAARAYEAIIRWDHDDKRAEEARKKWAEIDSGAAQKAERGTKPFSESKSAAR